MAKKKIETVEATRLAEARKLGASLGVAEMYAEGEMTEEELKKACGK